VESGVLWQDAVIGRVSALLRRIEWVRGLWLAGSLARGDADRLSDIDFVVAVDDQDLANAATMLENALAREFEIVLLRNRGFERFRLLNLVTAAWERLDLSLYPAGAIVESPLRGLRRVFDKDEIGAALLEEPALPAPPPTAEQVDYTLTEFARVLGLLPVVLHRNDLVGAIAGSGLLRELLVALLRYEQVGKPARGALNETAQLTSEAAKVLGGLPPLAADRASILQFNLACLAAFLDYGPRVADRYGVEWPARLVEALDARLNREFGDEFVGGPRVPG
jgi:predicted nucleotidyltransferase